MRILSFITILFLFISLFHIPLWLPWTASWFEVFWKSFVMALSAYMAYRDFKYKNLAIWNWVLIAMAVYYNPFWQINMTSTFISGCITVLYILFLFSFSYKRN